MEEITLSATDSGVWLDVQLTSPANNANNAHNKAFDFMITILSGKHLAILDLQTVPIAEGAEEDNEEIDKGPYAEAANSEQHKDTGCSTAKIEPVDTEASEEEAQEKGDYPALLGDTVRGERDGTTAFRADNCLVGDLGAAIGTILHNAIELV